MKRHFTGATYELTQENMNHLIAQLEKKMKQLEIAKGALEDVENVHANESLKNTCCNMSDISSEALNAIEDLEK